MSDFEKQYKMLNTTQKKAVDTIEGPVIVIAGPGTGKTQILTLRIANILKSAGAGIGPENILSLTFTNAGVVAMRERLATFIGAQEAYRTNIFTFHSFCEEQIRKYQDYFPTIAFARVVTEVERINIVEQILKNNDFKILKTFASETYYIHGILWAINQLKQEGISPEEFIEKIKLQEEAIVADPDSYYKKKTKNNKRGDLKSTALKDVKKNKELQVVYALYQEQLKEVKLYDFSDMIMQLVEVLERDEEFASILREQYQYILVDEHQDTNEGQNRIIDVLTSAEHLGDEPNLFTVGDDKQAIYRFQGANVENFLHFEKKFSGAVVINLVNNYRSAQGILDEAHALISSGNNDRNYIELTAFKKDDAVVNVRHFETYRDELVHMANDIHKKIGSGVAPEDIAVFYRENNNLDIIKEVLEKEGLPFVVLSKQNVLDDSDIGKLLLLIRLINNPMDSVVCSKVLLTGLLNVNVMDVLLILEEYKVISRQMTLFTFLSDKKRLDKCGIKDLSGVVKFVDFILEQKKCVVNMSFLAFFEQLIRESKFLEMIFAKDEHIFLLKKLERLFDEVRESVNEKKHYEISDFVRYIDTLLEYNLALDVVRSANIGGINLMTAHGSKGLEYEHVYITNVVDGLWGGKRKNQSFTLPIDQFIGSDEDERRLFYVAITRAKQSLVISYSTQDMNGRDRSPSVFLDGTIAKCVDIEQHVGDTLKAFFAPRISQARSLVSLEYIRETFLATPLSTTALNNYFSSPLLYFFRNLVRLPSAQHRTALQGTVIHTALERFFAASQENEKLLPKENLIKEYEISLDTGRVPAEYYDIFKKRGREILLAYYEMYKDKFSIDVVLEKKLRGIPFVLDSGEEILLTGTIDKIEFLKDGTVSVVDYKTGKTWKQKNKEERAALERQVKFYKLLLDSYNDGEFNMSEGMLDFIEPHRHTGELEQHAVSVNSCDVDELKKEINIFAHDILSGEFLEHDIEKKWGNKSLEEYVNLLQILKKQK